MKAIKIPNSALLDVFGRPVALNNHDLRRPSGLPTDKNSVNNHSDVHKKSSTATTSASKSDHSEQLTVIGKSNVLLDRIYIEHFE